MVRAGWAKGAAARLRWASAMSGRKQQSVTVTPGSGAPTPEEVKAWDEVAPGGAKILFEEYVRQLHHRRRMETASTVLAFLGPALGFVVVLAFLGTAAWLIDRGFGIEGTFLGTVDIASLAAVFALGRRMSDGS